MKKAGASLELTMERPPKRQVAGFQDLPATALAGGVIRDAAESRGRGFPVFARGVSPIPGRQDGPVEIGRPITCAGVRINPGDVVVADEDGIVVVPRARVENTLRAHGHLG